MRSIIDATQLEQRHGSAWNWCVNRDDHPNKITPEWIYKANTKAPWSETRGPGIGGPGPWARGSAVRIRWSNPYFSAVKYLHIRRCNIVTALNKASVRNEIWVLARLDPPNNNWVSLTMKPKWNLLGEKSLIIAPLCLLSYWFKWCPHTDSNRGPTDYKSVLLIIYYLLFTA